MARSRNRLITQHLEKKSPKLQSHIIPGDTPPSVLILSWPSYFGHRYYDACKGLWITADPAGSISGNNLYAYVLNNPLILRDPDGRFAIPLFCWAIGGTAACPLTWGVVAAVAIGYAACWSVQKMVDNGSLQTGSSAYTVTTGLVGGLTGSMINNSLEGNLSLSSTGVQSTTLCGDAYEFTYLNRKKEGSVDPSLPANPDDLLKRPGWKETTHPEAGKKGPELLKTKIPEKNSSRCRKARTIWTRSTRPLSSS